MTTPAGMRAFAYRYRSLGFMVIYRWNLGYMFSLPRPVFFPRNLSYRYSRFSLHIRISVSAFPPTRCFSDRVVYPYFRFYWIYRACVLRFPYMRPPRLSCARRACNTGGVSQLATLLGFGPIYAPGRQGRCWLISPLTSRRRIQHTSA